MGASIKFRCLILLTIFATRSSPTERKEFMIEMLQFRPLNADPFMCTSISINESVQHYITDLTPFPSQNGVHHMIIFGCENLSFAGYQTLNENKNLSAWSCWDQEYDKISDKTCSGKQIFFYGWVNGTRALNLPKGTKFPKFTHNYKKLISTLFSFRLWISS